MKEKTAPSYGEPLPRTDTPRSNHPHRSIAGARDSGLTRRIACIVALACGLVVLAPICSAQKAAAVPQVGFLGIDPAMQGIRLNAFRDSLRKLGYIEGTNVLIVERWADGDFGRLPALASELVGLKVDVLVTASPPAVRALQGATSTIPIVMIAHDLIGMGFVASLAHPGGNITGIAFQDSELSTKRLDLLRKVVPNLTRVAILWNKEGGGIDAVRAVESAANAMNIQTKQLEIRQPADFASAIATAKAWGAQGLVQLASPFITKNRKVLLDLLADHRIPATCELREYVVDGCLMTYSADLLAMFRGMGSFVDRILKGAKPADLPIEQPREFDFVINLRTAHALGLTIPPLLRLETTEVIQ
jgi:putative ABC transport system substrate-binding protein